MDGFTPPEIAPSAPFGSYSLSGFDHVNYYGGQMTVAIPLRGVAGRGEASYAIHAQIGRTWTIDRQGSVHNLSTAWWNPGPGLAPGRVEGRKVAKWKVGCANGQVDRTLTRLTLTMANGGEIELRDKLYNGEARLQPPLCTFQPILRGREFVAADGSGITFIADVDIYDSSAESEYFTVSGKAYLPNGTEYHVASNGRVSKIRDRNGNEMLFEYTDPTSTWRVTKITDPNGRETTISYDIIYSSSPPVTYDLITFKGYQGAQRQIKIYKKKLEYVLQSGSISLYSQLFPELNVGNNQSMNPTVTESIELPDGKKYQFKYNNYGEVVWIRLPSGARYEYTWVSGTGTGGGAYQGQIVLRRMSERRTYIDDSTSTVLAKMTVTRADTADCQPFSSMAGSEITVTHFNGPSTEAGREKHYYCGKPGDTTAVGPWDYATWKKGREYKTESLNLSTIVRSSKLTWAQRPSAGEPIWWGALGADTAPSNDPRVTVSEQTLHDVVPNLVAKQEFTYDQYNNRTEVLEYDYNQLTTPARRTHLEYVTSPSYLNAGPHLRGLVSKQWVCGSGSGFCLEAQAVSKAEYLYDGSTLTGGSIRFHDGVGHGTGYTTRGNLTTLRQWRNLPTSKWIESRFEYDIAGNPLKAFDPKNNLTQVGYVDNYSTTIPPGNPTAAFPTTMINALNHLVLVNYDYYLGRPYSVLDPNNVQTLFQHDDPLDRLSYVFQSYNVPADIQQTRFAYLQNLYTKPWLVETYSDQYAFNDQLHLTRTTYDKLGRQESAETLTKPSYYIRTVQSYDGLGRVDKKTYPYETSIGAPDFFIDFTTTAYDRLGRPISVAKPGGAAVTYSYSGNIVNVVDEAGKHRQTAYDALGRLKRVVEDPSGLGYITDYTYNALDKLTLVTQNVGGGTQQTRTFTYDSLGRLLTADNPEDAGLIQYTYDDNGNLLTRTDARGAIATMTYDVLNRVTQKTYSGAPGSSPAVRYCYDGNVYDLTTNTCVVASPVIAYAKGKLTGEGVSGWSATNYTGFDSRGRVTASVQRTITSGSTQTAYSFGYTYNRDGTLATQTYPSGKVVSFAYDRGGRPVNVAEMTGPLTTYVSSAVYAHHGAPDQVVFGNTLTEQSCYSTRDKLITRRLGVGTQANCSNPGTDLLRLTFTYGTPTTDNGNLTSQTIAAPSFSQTQYYGYDGVNRLRAASEGAALVGGTTCPTTTSWCQEYGYEAFGNRWVSFSNRTLHMATPTSASNFNAATNRLTGTGITYDNAGNLTAHPNITPGGGGMVYNASNKMTQFTATGVSVAYRYDAQQRRVRQDSGGQTTIWVYDAFGQLAAEYATNLTMVQGVYYRTTDYLGSTRIVTNQSAAVVQRRDFFPFGENIPADSSHGSRHLVLDGGQATYNAGLDLRQQFTGQQRDGDTGLDYFWARNHASVLGRFLSVDPGSAGVRTVLPQSWNAYSYALNNPLTFIDPDGKDPCSTQAGQDQGNHCFTTTVVAPVPQEPVPQPVWGGAAADNAFCDIHGTETPGCPEYEQAQADRENEALSNNLLIGVGDLPEFPILEAGPGAIFARLMVRRGLRLLTRNPSIIAKRIGFARGILSRASYKEVLSLHRQIGQQSLIRPLFRYNNLSGLAGARAALEALRRGENIVPPGLTRYAAEVYRELAWRVGSGQMDQPTGVSIQKLRFQIIEEAIAQGFL